MSCPASWGRGVATVLLRASERELRVLNFDQAVLWVLEENSRARRFYEREGWIVDAGVKIERRPGFTLRQVRYRRDPGGQPALTRSDAPASLP